MEWYEKIRQLRLEKNAAQPHEYTALACGQRAGVTQSDWSRMEGGKPVKQDGSAPSPTVKKCRVAAAGLNESYSMICKLIEFSGPDEENISLELVRRLDPLLYQVSEEKRAKVKDDILQVARIIISNAA